MTLSQDIEARIAILDIVNRYTQTKKAGVNYKALCPFHQEKTPSFIISPAKNIAKCFSCGKGGGPIRFLMEIEHIEFREAIAILAKEAGIALGSTFGTEHREKGKDPYQVYKYAALWYHQNLFLERSKEVRKYLQERGISEDIIKKFQLGYSSHPTELATFLKKQGCDPSFLQECGLFISLTRDKFFERLIFPIANIMGNPVAFTGRILKKGEPKYLNSPASKIFDKSAILYGLYLAKQPIIQSGEVYIVEGQMDTISLHQAGVLNTVGISGTALTKEHIRILKRFAKIIYLALDADNAGIQATFSSIENLLNSDLEIRIILIPNGKDPDEFLKAGGDFGALRAASLSAVEYYLKMGEKEYNIGTLIGKKQLIEKCLQLLVPIRSPIEIDVYLNQLSLRFGISRGALQDTFSQIQQRFAPEKKVEHTEKGTKFLPSTSDLLAGYIDKYSLLDLFFAHFGYNSHELSHIPGTGLLFHVIEKGSLDDEESEMLRTLDLYIDENFPSQHPDIIQKQFFDLLRSLHMALLEQEKKNRLKGVSPESSQYLEIYTQLIKKAQTLGIPQGSVTFL